MTGLRMLMGVSAVALVLGLSHLALAQDIVVPPDLPAPGGTAPTTSQSQTEAFNLITQAVGGNSQTASQLVQALGGDPVRALNALTTGSAGSTLAQTLGSNNAFSLLSGAVGSQNALSAVMGALGQTGSLNAMIGSLGGQGALNSLVGGLIGNNAAVASLQSLLSGNTAGLNALTSVLNGNMGALSTLTGALGGMDGALSALTGALGADGALSALTGALGVDGALAALTNVLGVNGALSALSGLLGDQLSGLVNVSGLCGFAPLTGTFAVSACNETKNTRSIAYAKEKQGGVETANKINQTLNERLEPALKDQAAQIQAGTIDQTRLLGSINDSAAASEAGRDIDGNQLAATQSLQPHDQTCALPTAGPALATTAQTGAAIARGLTNDAMAAANPVEGTAGAQGPAAVIANRFDEYCNFFVDPESNNGAPGCANIRPVAPDARGTEETTAPATGTTPEAAPAAAPAQPEGQNGEETADAEQPTETDGATSLLINGDIDVENILLSDTLDLENEHYRVASQALLRNLIVPQSAPVRSEEDLQTAAGKEWLVRKERIDTLRRIAADVVSGMIARRTSIDIPDAAAAGWIIPPSEMGGGMDFGGQCYVPNEPGNVNSQILARARNMIGNRSFGGACQRFVRTVSQNFMIAQMQQQRDVILSTNRESERRENRQMDNDGAIHAITAWAVFRHMGVATPCREGAQSQCLGLMRPGDLVYMASTSDNGRLYGHTGIFAGNNSFIGAHDNGISQIGLFGPSPSWERVGGRHRAIWGFVRPSGVGAQVADCGVQQPNTPDTTQASATPPPSGGAPASPAAPASPPAGGGFGSTGSYDQMIETLGRRESGGNYGSIGGSSGNYLGKYQMGVGALIEVGCVRNAAPNHSAPWRINYGYSTPVYRNYRWTRNDTCPGVTSYTQFMNNSAMQDRSVRRHNDRLIAQMRSHGSARYQCTTVAGQLVSPSGMICASHLVGAWGLRQWLASGGSANASDAFGTKAQEYLELCKNYDSPWGGACDGSRPSTSEYSTFTYNPPPPRNVDEVVREIRERAGIPPTEIAEDPSYNEIMLAMTKERFFDPRFFADLASNLPAMQQNESALNAYISMTLQDIHLLQEQINALAAARASMVIERDGATTNDN